MVQELIIFLVFIAATAYMGRMVYKIFSAKGEGCAKSCGACSTIDFKKIQQDLDRKAATTKA